MEHYLINDTTLSDIASAIREKRGNSAEQWLPSEMPEAIRGITGGGADDLFSVLNRTITGYSDVDEIATFIGSSAFQSCSALEWVNFPACISIYQYAFGNCTALQMLNFRDCTSIHSRACYGCTALRSVDFSSLLSIDSTIFSGFSNLRTASFPACELISNAAFMSCYALESFYLLGSSLCTLSNTNAFFSTPMYDSSYLGYYGSIFVPSSLYESYITAARWSAYSNRIVGV